MEQCIGAGGDGGDGGKVKQQSETSQTGDHNSGKTVRLHALQCQLVAASHLHCRDRAGGTS